MHSYGRQAEEGLCSTSRDGAPAGARCGIEDRLLGAHITWTPTGAPSRRLFEIEPSRQKYRARRILSTMRYQYRGYRYSKAVWHRQNREQR